MVYSVNNKPLCISNHYMGGITMNSTYTVNINQNQLLMHKEKTISEKCYSLFDLKQAMEYDALFMKKCSWPSYRTLLKEHMSAYTYAALITNSKNKALAFYDELLRIYRDSNAHLYIKKQIDILNGNIEYWTEKDKYKEPEKYLSSKEFFDQFLYYCKLGNSSYQQFVFLYKYGYPDDYIRYYEQYSYDVINYSQIHLQAAKIYNYMCRSEEAEKALKYYIQFGNNNNQKVISLYSYYSLYPLYNKELFFELNELQH